MGSLEAVPELTRSFYELVGELKALFPEQSFTMDGHLVGSIGVALAARQYGLELGVTGRDHDALGPDKRRVQVKVSQAKSVGLRSEPEHLIVLRFDAEGIATEVYNGPGAEPWQLAAKAKRNGQRPIAVSRLEILMSKVAPADRLESVCSGRPAVLPAPKP